MEETIVQGTLAQYKAFIDSPVWKDMRTELDVWKELARQEFESATEMTSVAKVQGRLEAIDYLVSLPNTFLETLEAEAEDKKQE